MKRKAKTTQSQYEVILDFIESNKVMLKGKCSIAETREVDCLWDQLAQILNSAGKGPCKEKNEWKRIFIEWKSKIKAKARAIEEDKMKGYGGTSKLSTLSDLEERLLSLTANSNPPPPPPGPPSNPKVPVDCTVEIADLRLPKRKRSSNHSISIEENPIKGQFVEEMENQINCPQISRQENNDNNMRRGDKTLPQRRGKKRKRKDVDRISIVTNQYVSATQALTQANESLACSINNLAASMQAFADAIREAIPMVRPFLSYNT